MALQVQVPRAGEWEAQLEKGEGDGMQQREGKERDAGGGGGQDGRTAKAGRSAHPCLKLLRSVFKSCCQCLAKALSLGPQHGRVQKTSSMSIGMRSKPMLAGLACCLWGSSRGQGS